MGIINTSLKFYPKGTYTSHGCESYHTSLLTGKKYRVIKEFIDYQRIVHPIGEEWIFLTYNFVPYHDGLSLIVSPDGEHEQIIQLQTIPEEQGEISENIGLYIAEVI